MESLQSKTEFSGETFERLNLVDTDVSGRRFYDCHFAHCNFSAAKLIDCLFDGCSFTECNLSNAVVKRSAFREVLFKSCKLVGIDWPSAKWPSVALSGLIEFDECILNGSSFFGLTLQELKMEACQVHEVDFTETDCVDASFIQSNFESSTFHQTNLTRADFTDATNYQIDVFTNRIDDATFSLPDAINLLRSLPIKVID
jgi:fluoroquinolone resistance protein